MGNWRRGTLSVGFCAALLLLATAARAQGAEPPEEDGHVVSLTISPIHLILPVVEVTGEVRLHPSVGVAGIVGGGRVTMERIGAEDVTFSVWELGAQGRYYALGDFEHGLQLGVEALYIGASAEVEDVSGSGSGLAIGPFVGYKIATGVGFTFDAQLGYQLNVIQAEAETESGESAEAERSGGNPLLNLNVGWSF